MNVFRSVGIICWPPEVKAKPTSPRGPGGTLTSILFTTRAGMARLVTWGALCSVPAGIRT